jgi:hypothetical protein
MRNSVEIENIEELRRLEGIEDVELRQEIRGLNVGDSVRLTFLAGATSLARETLLVRITRIDGYTFRGKLAKSPASTGLANLRAGSFVAFTTAHIHSLAKGQLSHEH